MTTQAPDPIPTSAEPDHHVQPRRLAPVAAVSAGSTIWLALLGLVTTPYMLHRLGPSAYAIFALVTIVIGYVSNLEFGFGLATLRFLARAHADGDKQSERKIIETSLFIFACAGTVGAVLAVAFAPVIATSFATFPRRLQGEAIGALRLGGILIVFALLYTFVTVALQALGSFRVLLVNRVLAGTLISLSAVVMAAIFRDVRAVLLAQIVISVIFSLVAFRALARTSNARLRPRFDRETFREMRFYALAILGGGIAYQALMQGPPTVLAGATKAAELTAFAVPAVVLQQIALLASAASTGFLPFASAESTRGDTARLSNVFRSHMRMTLVVLGPVTAYLIVFAHTLLSTWVGNALATHASDALRLLSAAGLVIALGGPAGDVARGLGRARWIVIYTGSAAILAIATAIPLTKSSGATGAAAALLIGTGVTTAPFVLLASKRLLHLGQFALLRALVVPCVAALGAAALYWGGSLVLDGFLGAVAIGAVVTAAYVAIAYRFVLDDLERATLAAGVEGVPVVSRLFKQAP